MTPGPGSERRTEVEKEEGEGALRFQIGRAHV